MLGVAVASKAGAGVAQHLKAWVVDVAAKARYRFGAVSCGNAQRGGHDIEAGLERVKARDEAGNRVSATRTVAGRIQACSQPGAHVAECECRSP